MTQAKIWGVCTVVMFVVVILFATSSQSGRNFLAEYGLLAPSTDEVSGIVLPFTSGMKVSLFSGAILCLIGWVISIMIFFVRNVTFTWQEPDRERNLDKFKAFQDGVPDDLKRNRDKPTKPAAPEPVPDKVESPETPVEEPQEKEEEK